MRGLILFASIVCGLMTVAWLGSVVLEALK
jgi:hypothetical protein